MCLRCTCVVPAMEAPAVRSACTSDGAASTWGGTAIPCLAVRAAPEVAVVLLWQLFGSYLGLIREAVLDVREPAVPSPRFGCGAGRPPPPPPQELMHVGEIVPPRARARGG